MADFKYTVIGAGAIGGFYGGKLANSGKNVNFLLHSDYNHVMQNGFLVESVDGDFLLKGEKLFYDNFNDLPLADVVLVCLKATSNHILKDILPKITKPDTTIILMQNGIGQESLIAEYAPDCSLIGGICFICSSKIGPGHVLHSDQGRLAMAEYKNDNSPAPISDIMIDIARDFQASGIEVALEEDLLLSRWKKLVWNIPYNGLSVLLDARTDELMDNAVSRSLCWELMLDVLECADSMGRDIPQSFAEMMMDRTDAMVPYKPSMKLDYDNKREMEIEAIYSKAWELANNNGFDACRIRMLAQALTFLQSKY